jgi:hypothetical protein
MKTVLFVLMWLGTSCIQSTGGNFVNFELFAAGDSLVLNQNALTFVNSRGYQVELTQASLHLGAVYFSAQNPQSYQAESNCIQPGTYTGQVRAGVDVNLLSTNEVAFAVQGEGTDLPTRAAEIWLSDGPLDAPESATPILKLAGVAKKDQQQFRFSARVTIGTNRKIPPRNAALPGSNSICHERIVAPIPFDAVLTQGAKLKLSIDVRAFVSTVDFGELSLSENGERVFIDDISSSLQPDVALFNNLKSAQGPWRFELIQ